MRRNANVAAMILCVLAACDQNGCRSGCQSGSGDHATSGIERVAGERPDGIEIEARVSGGSATLAAIKEHFQNPLIRAALPANIAELSARQADFPGPVVGAIDRDSDLVFITQRRGDQLARGGAVRVQREVGDADPFGENVQLMREGPGDARWLREEAADGAAALVDNVVIAGRDDEMVEDTWSYLAFGALAKARDEESGVVVELADAMIHGSVRRELEGSLTERAADARRAIRAARAQREDAPTLDPNALLTLVEEKLASLIAFLPDVRSTKLSLRSTPRGLQVVVSIGSAEDSPLRRTIEAAPVGNATLLRALPDSTALGIFSPGPAPDGSPLSEEIATLAGERLSAEERAQLTSALGGVRDARNGASLLAIGSTNEAPWLAFAQRGAPSNRDEVAQALSANYLRELGAHLLGCDEVAAPVFEGDVAPLCDVASFAWAASDSDLALGLGTNPAQVTTRLRDAMTTPGTGSLASFPDVERATTAHDTVLLGAVFSPARVLAAIQLLGAFRTEDRPVMPPVVPIVALLSRTNDGGVTLETTLSVRAITQLTELAAGFL